MKPAYLAIDPGKRSGWAAFNTDGTLVACGIMNGASPKLPAWCVACPQVIIEHPHEGDSKASKKDLCTLARRLQNCLYEACGGLPSDSKTQVEEVLPNRWKGNIPKEIRLSNGKKVYPGLDRTRRKMLAEEYAVFAYCMQRVAKSSQHNALDAIGIGIWWGEVKGYRDTRGRYTGSTNERAT